jgi:hypothetical protein
MGGGARMKKTQLNIAWMWDCDKCGEENFERGFIPEGDPERLAELAAETVDDPDPLLVAFPFEVVCWNCGEEYETEVG